MRRNRKQTKAISEHVKTEYMQDVANNEIKADEYYTRKLPCHVKKSIAIKYIRGEITYEQMLKEHRTSHKSREEKRTSIVNAFAEAFGHACKAVGINISEVIDKIKIDKCTN